MGEKQEVETIFPGEPRAWRLDALWCKPLTLDQKRIFRKIILSGLDFGVPPSDKLFGSVGYFLLILSRIRIFLFVQGCVTNLGKESGNCGWNIYGWK